MAAFHGPKFYSSFLFLLLLHFFFFFSLLGNDGQDVGSAHKVAARVELTQ